MKVFLAGTSTRIDFEEIYQCPYVLESFISFDKRQKRQIENAEMFMLDSGAFTFMNRSKNGRVDFDEYLCKYIRFINENDIRYFFELDLDSIVGYDEVKRYRRILERETGRKCIPVWHRSRGLEEYKRMCDEYDYAAIGGIVTGEIIRKEYEAFTPLLKIARASGCKMHGLGFTYTDKLHEYRFDSVDSTTWLAGCRFGMAYYFNGRIMKQYKKKDCRVAVHYKTLDRHNIREWMKFQKYADCHL